MRNSLMVLGIASVLVLGSSAAVAAGPPAAIDARQITELITELGSASFKEREAATQALEALGGPALEAVQQAALSSDPEVGRRAQNLAHTIQRRIETAQLLAPLRLRLVYKETPVLQAIEDLAKRTEFPIVSSRARLANRKITLDTGETSFWEAFDQFCQKAGLVERTAPAESDLQMRRDATGGALLAQIVEASPSLGSGRSWDRRLVLVDGRPPLLPTYHAGSVRIRALPANGAMPETTKGETLFLVEITPQPNLAWQNIIDLRIDKAVDENGQDFAPSLETRHELSRAAVTGNGAIVWDAQTGRPLTAPRDIPVRFKSSIPSFPISSLGTKGVASGVLKEVKGVVAAQVQTAPQAIITVESILKSAGRTLMSDDGESLKVVEANRQPNGNVHVRIELTDASSANALWVVRRGVLRPNRLVLANGVVRRGVLGADSAAPANLVLQDADGHSFPERSRSEDLVINGNTLTREITLTYQSRAGLGEPSKLVYSGQRTIIIEVPFTLKDVPLP